jgi:CspA family cold shock protein
MLRESQVADADRRFQRRPDMAQGTVKFFNSQKGFGFIQPTDGGADVFVHISAVERAGMSNLNEGQKLTYDVVSERGKLAASNLQNVWSLRDWHIGSGAQAPERFALAGQCSRCRPCCRRRGGAYPALSNNNRKQEKMARKPATRVEFTLFDVIYEDGSQRSNRRVPSEILGGLDGDAPARAIIEEQDRLIAERSGTPPLAVKSMHRSGDRKAA